MSHAFDDYQYELTRTTHRVTFDENDTVIAASPQRFGGYRSTPPPSVRDEVDSYGLPHSQSSSSHEEEGKTKRHWKQWTFLPPNYRERLHDWFFGGLTTIPECVQERFSAVVDELDDTTLDDARAYFTRNNPDQEFKPPTNTPRQHYSIIAELANECKCTLPGIGVDTAANRLVAMKWIRGQMVERNMRKSHIVKMLPMAVSCVFIQNIWEVEAQMFENSHAYVNRRNLNDSGFVSRDNPWIGNWFGSINRAKPTARG